MRIRTRGAFLVVSSASLAARPIESKTIFVPQQARNPRLGYGQ